MKNITIFAMTEKGFAVVKSIYNAFPNIIKTVISARDINIENDFYTEIMSFCKKNSIDFYDRFDAYEITTKYTLAISWRWIINNNLSRLIVFHDSLLPKYRGFNPLVTALINGDKTIGVTALYATDEYDKGNIIFQAKSNICYPIQIQTAITIIIENYKELAVKMADCISNNIEIASLPQCENDASYSLWRDEEDYFIDWNKSSDCIKKIVDALGSPYKGACSSIDGAVVRIFNATVLDDIDICNRTSGKVVFIQDSKPVIVCGEGLLRLDEIIDADGNVIKSLNRFRTRFKNAYV